MPAAGATMVASVRSCSRRAISASMVSTRARDAATSSGLAPALRRATTAVAAAHAIGRGLDPRLGKLAASDRVIALLLGAGAVLQQLHEARFVSAGGDELGFRRLLICRGGRDLRLGLPHILDARPGLDQPDVRDGTRPIGAGTLQREVDVGRRQRREGRAGGHARALDRLDRGDPAGHLGGDADLGRFDVPRGSRRRRAGRSATRAEQHGDERRDQRARDEGPRSHDRRLPVGFGERDGRLCVGGDGASIASVAVRTWATMSSSPGVSSPAGPSALKRSRTGADAT